MGLVGQNGKFLTWGTLGVSFRWNDLSHGISLSQSKAKRVCDFKELVEDLGLKGTRFDWF